MTHFLYRHESIQTAEAALLIPTIEAWIDSEANPLTGGCTPVKSFYIFYIFALISLSLGASAKTVFRFHSGLEPSAVDPVALNESTGGFMFSNLYRSLYRLDRDGLPVPELAERCEFKNKERTRLHCYLKKGIAFSNGTPILSQHFVYAWRRLVDPKSGSRHGDLLYPIKGGAAVAAGHQPPDTLGVRASSDSILELQLEQPNAEIFVSLASPLLTPLLSEPPKSPDEFSQSITSGPYRIAAWERKTKIRLENNPHYFEKTSRPDVEILMIDEDASALQMFDLGKLDFLRRLNVKEIPFRRDKPGFIFHPAMRFDYIGFGPRVSRDKNFRKALALSLNYDELTLAFKTPGQVGCPSFPERLATPWVCLKFNLKEAKRAWSKVPENAKSSPLIVLYSKAGGEDIGRGMEWMQAQWKKHLGVKVELRPLENSMYLSELKQRSSDIFRKGVNLDRPTCSAALENFLSTSPENYISLQNMKLTSIIEKLRLSQTELERKNWCGKGLEIIVGDHYLIPLGEIYFSMLENQKFKGFYLTPLNQLDLTLLQPKD